MFSHEIKGKINKTKHKTSWNYGRYLNNKLKEKIEL